MIPMYNLIFWQKIYCHFVLLMGVSRWRKFLRLVITCTQEWQGRITFRRLPLSSKGNSGRMRKRKMDLLQPTNRLMDNPLQLPRKLQWLVWKMSTVRPMS